MTTMNPGTSAFAVDDRQNIIHGILVRRERELAVIETHHGRYRRRRRFHARYVFRDWP